MVSFIHNGSEITTWVGYSFKTKKKEKNPKQHLQDKNIFFNPKQQDSDY